MNRFALAIAQLRLASSMKRSTCRIRPGRQILNVLASLKEMGFIRGYAIDKNSILVHFRYRRTKVGLRKLAVFSKQTNRVYMTAKQVLGRRVSGYYKTSGALLISTSVSDRFFTEAECIMAAVGGEPMLIVG